MSLLAGVRGAYERSRYYTQMKLELWEIVFQSGWWGIWDYGPNKNNERKQWYWGQSSNKSIWVETKCFSTRFRIRVKVRLLAQADYAITLTMIGIVAALKKRVHKIWTSVESKRRHTYVAVWIVTLLSQIAIAVGLPAIPDWRSWFSYSFVAFIYFCNYFRALSGNLKHCRILPM